MYRFLQPVVTDQRGADSRWNEYILNYYIYVYASATREPSANYYCP